MRLYHTTDADGAASILRAGFRNRRGSYGLSTEEGHAFFLNGVWFANWPVGFSEGAAGDPISGDPILVIDLDEAAITKYELIEEGKTYREWCIPARLANAHLLGVIHEPDDWTEEAWWEVAEPKADV